MNSNFSKVQTRAIQYWFVDGLAEIAAGLVSLLVAILFGLWQVIFMWRWSLLVILITGFTISVGLRLIIQRIKERTTYPRTGFVSHYSGLESRRSIVITVAFVLLLLGSNYYFTTNGPQSWLWSPAMAGLAFALSFAWIGALMNLRRFYFLALPSLTIGMALAALGMDFFRGVGILAGVVGLILLFQGYRALKAYIHQNPALSNPINE